MAKRCTLCSWKTPTCCARVLAELVQRLLLTDDELHRALARVAGVVEVEALGFEVERNAFDILTRCARPTPTRWCHWAWPTNSFRCLVRAHQQ